jgi:hypothetical protein
MSTSTITQEAVIEAPIVETPTMPDVIVKNRDIFLGVLRLTPESRRCTRSYFLPHWNTELDGTAPVQAACVLGLAYLTTGRVRNQHDWVRDIAIASLGISMEASMAIDEINYGEDQTFAMTADWLEANFASDDPEWNRIPGEHEPVYPFVDEPIHFA